MSIGKIKPEVSVVIPTFNEEGTISLCIKSLLSQTYTDFEIIVIDDGSKDETTIIVQKLRLLASNLKIRFYTQKHRGPGEARNLGARKAKGKVIVFIDGDFVLERNFLKELLNPIFHGRSVATDTQGGYLANPQNFWARSWNIGRFAAAGIRNSGKNSIVPRKSKKGTIYRAIIKDVFNRAGGFDTGGDYTDDESLFKKIKVHSLVTEAKYFHYDPDSLSEVWKQASWVGSDRNFTRGTARKIVNLFKFFLPVCFIKSLIISSKYNFLPFIPFKLVYDSAVFCAILRSFFAHKLTYPETFPFQTVV